MGFVQFFTSLVEKYGVFGIFIGSVLESIGVPFANSAQVLASGQLIEAHRVTYWGIIWAVTIGNIVGSTIAYWLGYFLGNSIRKFRHGLLYKNEQSTVKFIKKYGNVSVFLGQLYGTTRTFISIPAGMLKMEYKPFIIYTALGGFLFSILVTSFSLVISDAYNKYILPILGVSFATAAILLGITLIIINFVIKKGDKLKNYLKKLFS